MCFKESSCVSLGFYPFRSSCYWIPSSVDHVDLQLGLLPCLACSSIPTLHVFVVRSHYVLLQRALHFFLQFSHWFCSYSVHFLPILVYFTTIFPGLFGSVLTSSFMLTCLTHFPLVIIISQLANTIRSVNFLSFRHSLLFFLAVCLWSSDSRE